MSMNAPEVERRAAAGGVSAHGRTLSGYAAVFDASTRIGGYTERIARGAFAESLASGRDVLALLDHKPDTLLGRTRSGTLKLSEDSKGLKFDLTLPDTQAGRDLIALAVRGDLGGMSFGFVAVDEAWTDDIRELRAVELHEISVVQSWPAYQQTEVSLRARQRSSAAGNLRLWLETCR